jgi:hypothetical protein
MSRTTKTILTIAGVALGLLAPAAWAGQGAGLSLFTPGEVEAGEMADGARTEMSMATGFAVSYDPNSPLHLMTQDCSAKWLIAADGSGRTGKGECRSTTPEGDEIVFWWKGTQEGGTWGFESGTGAWEGVTGGGTWAPAAMWEDGRYANTWQGEWTGGPEGKVEQTEEETEPAPLQNPLETGGD